QIRALAPEVRNLAAALDAERDLTARRAAARRLYAVLFAAGLHQVEATPKVKGYGLGAAARLVLFEELARADAGVAMALLSTSNAVARAEAIGGKALRQRIVTPCIADTSGAWLL